MEVDPAAPTGWRSLLTPYALLAGVIAASIAVVRGFAPVQDPQLWWLAWAGRLGWSGQYPRTNLGSYTDAELPWVLHEPLVAMVEAAVGPDLVGLLRLGLLAGLAVLTLRLATRRDGGIATSLALLGMPIVLLFGLSERAMAWGLLELAGLMILLFDGGRVRTERWRLLAAAGLVVLWANTHGSFVVGLGLLALVSPLWAVGAAVACLANPAGWGLFGLVGTYLTGDGTVGRLGEGIVEWAWLDVTDPFQLAALVWVVLAGVLLWSGPLADRRATWTARLLTLVVLAMTVRSWRNAPIAGLVLLPFVAARLATLLPARPLGRPGGVLAVLLLLGLAAGPPIAVDEELFPDAALDGVGADERIWADYRLGGWLLWHGREVFWDGRNDCYSEDTWDQGLQVTRRREGWTEVLDAWSVDVVMTSDPALADALVAEDWVERSQVGSVRVVGRR